MATHWRPRNDGLDPQARLRLAFGLILLLVLIGTLGYWALEEREALFEIGRA